MMQGHCSVSSVKSAAYLTKDGFKSEFVSDAWAQWSDGPVSTEHGTIWLWQWKVNPNVQTAWEDIEHRSITGDPKHLADQLTKAGSSSAIE